MKITLKSNNKSITLSKANFIASGGEGNVYSHGSKAIKIYHDPSKMIPIGKIQELSKLTPKNVLVPRDICLVKDNPVGFVMDCINERIFLKWVCDKGWKLNNNVTGETLEKIFNIMRKTTIILHNEGCVVGDYNIFQFLLGKNFKTVYFVDTDSYQTKSYPCTAIMDTVRDRTVPFGEFSKQTDWFGFAVTTFEVICGIHPYMGRHPNYSKKDSKSLKMMDNNISVFHSGVTLPKMAEPISALPKNTQDWYKAVFVNNERSIPPEAKDTIVTGPTQRSIISDDTFECKILYQFETKIIDSKFINGNFYTLCVNRKLYKNSNIKYTHFDIKNILGYCGGKEEVAILNNNNSISLNGICYSNLNGTIYKHLHTNSFSISISSPEKVDEVPELSTQVFKGCYIYEIFGIKGIATPTDKGFINRPIGLQKHRIVDACWDYSNNLGVAIIISEFQGKYFRTTYTLIKNSESVHTEECDSNEKANVVVLDRGIGITFISDEKMNIITSLGTKEIKNPPIDSSIKLITDRLKLIGIVGDKLIQISTKK